MAEDGKPANVAQAAAPPPPIAGKAKDLEALRNAVVDAANVSAGFWFSYLFVLLYFIIAVGSVTHRNLFFETPIKLPILNVDLPLVGFFVLGPGLFLIVHAYILLHFAMFADKVGAFHAELQAQITDEDVRARLRRQLPSNIFVQFLAGPREVRTGLMGMMLRLIALISLVVGPIVLLVFFQIQFLPYQDEVVTWWQRIAVVADLGLLWALWPSVARGETTAVTWRDLRRWKAAVAALMSAVPVLLVFTITTFPGEWLNEIPISPRFIPQLRTPSNQAPERIRWISLHKLLVAGDVDLIARRPTSLWSNRLVLPNLEEQKAPFSLRGRRLEGAVLISASLKNMDFTAVRLKGAVLDHADLREAKFECANSKLLVGAHIDVERRASEGERHCADLQQASLVGAQLQGARLTNATLRGAEFTAARLQDANLDQADLEDATLDDANLQGASLFGARLRHASLWNTNLRGAKLNSAILHGARLNSAELKGANLDGAQLQGASLASAQLQGASFAGAHLEGASLMLAKAQGAVLSGAWLTGASLDGALLQGATFSQARLDGASLDSAALHGALLDADSFTGASLRWIGVWRSKMPRVRTPIRLKDLEVGPTMPGATQACSNQSCNWTSGDFEKTRKIIEEVPVKSYRERALQAFVKLDPTTVFEGEQEMAREWSELVSSPVSPQVYETSLAGVLREVGCDRTGAPFIISGLAPLIAGRFGEKSPHPSALATAFLDHAHCPGAVGLRDETKDTLRALQKPAAPQR